MAKKDKMKNKKPAAKYIREGDLVFIVAGNDKGRSGKVLSRAGTQRVIVEGINIRTKHMKPRSSGEQGSIVKMESSIHLSNVKLCMDPEQPYSVKVKISEQGQKDLYYMKAGKEEIYRTIRKSKVKGSE